MSYIKRNITEELIHAYVDENLSPEEHVRFERLLKNDSKLLEKVESYQAQNVMLHNMFDSVLDEPIPAQLTPSPRNIKAWNFPFKLIASVLLLCIGGFMGWFVKDNQTPRYNIVANLAQMATRAHMVYTPEIKHPVEVAAEQEQHLVKWLSKRLGNSVKAPDLTSEGYELVGGRLLPSTTGPAAQFMYENNIGERLTLFVRTKLNIEKNVAFRYYVEQETNVFYWVDAEFGYALVGSVSKPELLGVSNLVYRQLSL